MAFKRLVWLGESTRKCCSNMALFYILADDSSPFSLAQARMMNGSKKLVDTALIGSMHSGKITQCSETARFVQYHPMAYSVARPTCTDFAVLREPINNIAVCPTSTILEFLW